MARIIIGTESRRVDEDDPERLVLECPRTARREGARVALADDRGRRVLTVLPAPPLR